MWHSSIALHTHRILPVVIIIMPDNFDEGCEHSSISDFDKGSFFIFVDSLAM